MKSTKSSSIHSSQLHVPQYSQSTTDVVVMVRSATQFGCYSLKVSPLPNEIQTLHFVCHFTCDLCYQFETYFSLKEQNSFISCGQVQNLHQKSLHIKQSNNFQSKKAEYKRTGILSPRILISFTSLQLFKRNRKRFF